RASTQADQALGVLADRAQAHERLRRGARLLTRVRVRASQYPAEVRPAPGVLNQKRQMTPVLEINLRAVDRAQAERLDTDRELHRAGDRVVVGQREPVIAERECARDELIGERCPV